MGRAGSRRAASKGSKGSACLISGGNTTSQMEGAEGWPETEEGEGERAGERQAGAEEEPWERKTPVPQARQEQREPVVPGVTCVCCWCMDNRPRLASGTSGPHSVLIGPGY